MNYNRGGGIELQFNFCVPWIRVRIDRGLRSYVLDFFDHEIQILSVRNYQFEFFHQFPSGHTVICKQSWDMKTLFLFVPLEFSQF